jgi:hypothetical protein
MGATDGNTPVFSWRAVLVAPLIVPVITSVIVVPGPNVPSPWLGVLVFVAIGSIVSYGAMIFLLLPSLLLLRRRITITSIRATALGALLAIVVFLPIAQMMWMTSGVDSGPPEDTFLEFLARQVVDPFNLFFPAAGAVTAGAYWLLLPRRAPKRAAGPPP